MPAYLPLLAVACSLAPCARRTQPRVDAALCAAPALARVIMAEECGMRHDTAAFTGSAKSAFTPHLPFRRHHARSEFAARYARMRYLRCERDGKKGAAASPRCLHDFSKESQCRGGSPFVYVSPPAVYYGYAIIAAMLPLHAMLAARRMFMYDFRLLR